MENGVEDTTQVQLAFGEMSDSMRAHWSSVRSVGYLLVLMPTFLANPWQTGRPVGRHATILKGNIFKQTPGDSKNDCTGSGIQTLPERGGHVRRIHTPPAGATQGGGSQFGPHHRSQVHRRA